MKTIKFSVTNYHGIGECPLVILLDKEEGEFKHQFHDIDELKTHLGEEAIIYFVANKDNTRIQNLHNWNTKTKFNYDELFKL